MLSKELYCAALNKINNLSVKSDLLEKGLTTVGIEVNTIVNPLEDLLIDVLQEAMGDETAWTSWFMYENDFGSRGLEVKVESTPIKTDTPEDIYDLIIGNPTYLVKEHKCSCGRH